MALRESPREIVLGQKLSENSSRREPLRDGSQIKALGQERPLQ